jgi:formate hydrogenlyase subunit 6/NADH:ubiquinone oxidoreductase subunit I/flavodoxin
MKRQRAGLTRRQLLGAALTAAGAVTIGLVAKVSGLFSGGKAAPAGAGPAAAAGRALRGVVVYYSATGSTAKVAKAIHAGMRELLECDLLSVAEADPKKMAQYDVIGIGGPIWYFRETANLRLFVWKLPQLAGKLCFQFCTHGSEPTGFFASLAQMLDKRGLTIIGWKDWYGSVLQVLHMPKPYLTDGHPDTIDVDDARAFGREMAGRAQRITAGERDLIPVIPTGPDADELWINQRTAGAGPMMGPPPSSGPAAVAAGAPAPSGTVPGTAFPPGQRPNGGFDFGGPAPPVKLPVFDMKKCVYPRCNACEEGCPVGAIDFTLAARGSLASGSDLVVTKACVGCSICERLCAYDACKHESAHPKTLREFDMQKCIYPKCTLCQDKCPMHSIDLTQDPPVVHNDCEGCDLCYCLCPKDAIRITNMQDTQIPLRMTGPDHPFVRNVEKYEHAGRFRRLVPIDKVGFDHPVFMNPNAPRIVLNPDPYEVAIYCDQACKT